MKTLILTCFLPTCFGMLTPTLQAGTVISTNLPAGTHIVNINAKTDGASTHSPDPMQSLWYRPMPASPSVTLPAGTYRFRIVNPADAAALFPALTAPQLSQIYTGWTYNSPWIENYFVFNASALANPAEHQIFDGAIAVTSYVDASAAYSGSVFTALYNKIRPAPPGRNGGPSTYLSEWTFTTATSLVFVVPDYDLGDNNGGVSVIISPVDPAPVPEYASTVLNAGPVAYWRFDEPGGVTAADSAGTFHGTLSSTGAAFTGCGISGNAISLNRATGGLVNMGTGVPGFTSGDYSIMLWVKNTETVINTLPLTKHAAGTQNGYRIQINQNSDGGALNKATFTAGAELVSHTSLHFERE